MESIKTKICLAALFVSTSIYRNDTHLFSCKARNKVLHYPLRATSSAYYFSKNMQLAGLYILVLYVNLFKTEDVPLFRMSEKTA
jgi:hypothetical protein